ncbi:MAG: neutral zinc metallopeptidase, partial [Myxococcota bacterium]
MKWDRGHQSDDVVDARGRAAPARTSGGGVFALFRIASMFGWKGIVVAALLVGAVFVWSSVQPALVGPTPTTPASDESLQFSSFVLDDVQNTWDQQLKGYQHTKLIVYRNATRTGCGYGAAATGPFYCPEDQQVYIDLSFYDELAQRFGAPGDFAQAYVIAHEVGHHVQHL